MREGDEGFCVDAGHVFDLGTGSDTALSGMRDEEALIRTREADPFNSNHGANLARI